MSKSIKELRQKYACLVRWCLHMGSYDYYIDNEVQQAENDNAQATVIYKRNGVWSIAEQIADEDLRKQILGE